MDQIFSLDDKMDDFVRSLFLSFEERGFDDGRIGLACILFIPPFIAHLAQAFAQVFLVSQVCTRSTTFQGDV